MARARTGTRHTTKLASGASDAYPYAIDEQAVLENKVKIVEKWVDDEKYKQAFYGFHESYGG